MTKQKRPKVGTAVCILKDDKVLLGLRKNCFGGGKWCFPGGHLEFGEEWSECAARETMEETGIKIKNISLITITNDIYKKENKHYLTIFMSADYKSGEVKLTEPDVFEKWQWFEWDKLPKPLMQPILELIKQGFNPLK